MPHATMPAPGFQALILCGPGASLNTFTSNPQDFPKALIPIANRPMVWYPLEWCYRMGITNINLVTPPESAAALDAALSQNPHLTSLPAPKPDILAPRDLTQTTGTGEIFRLPEVQAAITGDFVVLPCDLICELDGESLLEAWMVKEAGLGAATGGIAENGQPAAMGIGGERSGRRGGLGVWYETKGENNVKKQETDFIATTSLPEPVVPPPADSLRRDISKLVFTMPTATLKDITEEKKCFPIRHSLLRKHGRIKMLTSHRDAHIYFFPYWVAEMMKGNERFDSVAEDAVGWWAKAGWQEGLGEKLGLGEILERPKHHGEESMHSSGVLDGEVDVTSLTSTWVDTFEDDVTDPLSKFASRVRNPIAPNQPLSPLVASPKLKIPPILAYVQPSAPELPLITRVDTAQLLLHISLRLAKLPSVEEGGRASASPLAHAAKIAHPDTIPKKCRVESENTLVAENVTIEERCNIKECVIGANCKIAAGARLQRCLLMDGVEIGENCQLTGCIVGRRCKIEGGPAKSDDKTVLKECEVQEGQVISWGTEAKDEKFMRFEGLSEDEDMEMGDDAPAEGFDSDS